MNENSKQIEIKFVINIIIAMIILWTASTTIIQAFKNPSLTQTELFLKIPKSFVLNFDKN